MFTLFFKSSPGENILENFTIECFTLVLVDPSSKTVRTLLEFDPGKAIDMRFPKTQEAIDKAICKVKEERRDEKLRVVKEPLESDSIQSFAEETVVSAHNMEPREFVSSLKGNKGRVDIFLNRQTYHCCEEV